MGCDCFGDFPEWSVDDMNAVTKQVNGCYCGIFTCMFVILLSVDQPIYFDQKFISGKEWRNCIGLSILREELGNIFEWIYYINM